MKMFTLEREVDHTGVTVAEGIEFSDGTVAIRWVIGEHNSTVVWDSIDDAIAIHGHDGATLVVFQDKVTWGDLR